MSTFKYNFENIHVNKTFICPKFQLTTIIVFFFYKTSYYIKCTHKDDSICLAKP